MSLTKQVLRNLITCEMLAFHPDCGWDPDHIPAAVTEDKVPAAASSSRVGGGTSGVQAGAVLPVEPTSTAVPTTLAGDSMGDSVMAESAAASAQALAGTTTLEDELVDAAPMEL